MGGIKNKLKQLSNKVANLVFSARLGSSASGTASRRTPASKAFDDSGLRSKPVGLLSITKYASITCLSLAILSTLILNIVSSYSSSKIESNAIDSNSEVSTLAQATGSATISLSITPLTTPTSSPCDTSNSNICMEIPDEGGIATGGHTIEVDSNAVNGYTVAIASDIDSKDSDLVLTKSDGSKDYSRTIKSLPIINTTADSFTPISGTDGYLANYDSAWGIAIPGLQRVRVSSSSIGGGLRLPVFAPSGYFSSDGLVQFSGLPLYGDNSLTLYNDPNCAITDQCINDFSFNQCSATELDTCTETDNDIIVAYAAIVNNPSQMTAGNYTANIVYTATTISAPAPTVSSVEPGSYELGSGASGQVTINGANLESAYSVYLTNTNGDKIGDCTNLKVTNDTQLTCTIPTDQTNPDLEPGDYTIHVVTQGGEGSAGFSYTKPTLPAGVRQVTADYGSDGHVAVDFDEHMIPVKYAGNTTTPRWEVVTDAELESNPANWFSYTADKKQWANAVTVTESSLQEYLNAEKGSNQHYEVDNDDVLGYWVYIPRYAYEVMRRDAIDAPITTPETFDIKFEVSGDVKKVPVRTCSTVSSHRDYRSCSGVNRSYGNETGTTWATHPAFTFGEEELNGFWIGKFLTTGEISAPTVKPNQQANLGNTAGEYYTAAKSIGKEDENNVGGSLVSGISYNSHNMVYTSSTLVRNSEWGATAYLAMSKFGQGDINNINTNKAGGWDGVTRNTDRDGDAQTSGAQYGITGCGALTLDDPSKWASLYNDGTRLNVSRYESATACSTENTQRSYNGTYGVVSSTTGNVYGLYDFNASSRTYVAANLTNSNLFTTSNSTVFAEKAGYPYVDLYYTGEGFNTRPSWSNSTDSQKYNNDVCTWETCGGQAMYEVSRSQSLSDDDAPVSTWANTALGGASGISMFVDSSLPWVIRAGFYVGSSPVAYDNWDGSVYKSQGVYYRISIHL